MLPGVDHFPIIFTSEIECPVFFERRIEGLDILRSKDFPSSSTERSFYHVCQCLDQYLEWLAVVIFELGLLSFCTLLNISDDSLRIRGPEERYRVCPRELNNHI